MRHRLYIYRAARIYYALLPPRSKAQRDNPLHPPAPIPPHPPTPSNHLRVYYPVWNAHPYPASLTQRKRNCAFPSAPWGSRARQMYYTAHSGIIDAEYAKHAPIGAAEQWLKMLKQRCSTIALITLGLSEDCSGP